MAPVAVFGVACVVLLVFAILVERVLLAQSAFELDRLQTKLTAAQNAREVVLLETATLESPARIERYARDTLGMVEAEEPRYIAANLSSPAGASLASRRRSPALTATVAAALDLGGGGGTGTAAGGGEAAAAASPPGRASARP